MRKATVSKEDCRIFLLDLFNKHGRLTETLIEEYAPFSRRTVRTHFHSLGNFKKEHNLVNKSKASNISKRRKRKHSKEECITEAQRLQDKYGYFSKKLLEEYGEINHKVYKRLWGSFKNFYKEVPTVTYKPKNINSDEEIFSSLLKVYSDCKCISTELVNEYCIVSLGTIIKRFGSLKRACRLGKIPYNPYSRNKQETFWTIFVSKYLKEKPIKQQTFPWLKYKALLRCDAYFPKHNLVMEYNGRQHYQRCRSFHKTKEDFLYQQNRDTTKYKLLHEHGINLLVIKYNDKKETVINNLIRILGLSA